MTGAFLKIEKKRTGKPGRKCGFANAFDAVDHGADGLLLFTFGYVHFFDLVFCWKTQTNFTDLKLQDSHFKDFIIFRKQTHYGFNSFR